MKNIYKAAAAFILAATSAANAQFFTATSYRGAFDAAPTQMWTDGWCQWDPQNTSYPAATMTVSANITSNTTWTSGNIYLLQGVIYVTNNATLTIQPGTVILGDKGTPNSSLIISKGSMINAMGTSTSPIVFTSNQAAGSRAPGDWGGVMLLGKATINVPGGLANIEGLAPATENEYGGGSSANDADNSGTLAYVRIEFGGYIFQPNKEINALTMGGVGSGTTIHHVQTSFTNDDGFEWFGGKVNASHLVSFRNLDDDFDTDFGYSGMVQFGLVVRDPNLADNPSVSTSEGFESDNDATGSSNSPLTSAIFSNITLVGPYRGNTASAVATGYRRGARIRRNSNLKIFNSIFMDFPRGLHIDGTACEANIQSGGIKFENNIVWGTSPGKVTEVNTGSTLDLKAIFAANANDSLPLIAAGTDILTTPYNYTSPDYRPATSSAALTGADFSDAAFAGQVTGINTVNTKNTITLYPNPASEILNLQLSQHEMNAEVILFNSVGQEVKRVRVTAIDMEIDVAELPAGMYVIAVLSESGIRTAKFSVGK